MAPMAFTPVEFTKNGETRVADSPSDYWELVWDGWKPGSNVVPGEPQGGFTEEQLDMLRQEIADALAAVADTF